MLAALWTFRLARLTTRDRLGLRSRLSLRLSFLPSAWCSVPALLHGFSRPVEPGLIHLPPPRTDRRRLKSLDNFCADVVQNGVEMAWPVKSVPEKVNPVPYGQLPRRINKGRLLVHNDVEHSVNTTSGRNGFRAWTQSEPTLKELVKCNCGWAGLPHYRMAGDQ
jgi:hypothetical protein